MIDAAPNTTAITDKLPSPTWQRWFRSVSDWIRKAETISLWDPVISGDIGDATAEGSYVRVGSVVYLSLTITPSGTWSAAQGVTSVSLPIEAAKMGVCVVAQGGTILGAAEAYTAISLPTISTSSPVVISGQYLIRGS